MVGVSSPKAIDQSVSLCLAVERDDWRAVILAKRAVDWSWEWVERRERREERSVEWEVEEVEERWE